MKTMIGGELRRLFQLKTFYLLLAVIAGALALLSYMYGENFSYQSGYNGYGIVKYEMNDLPAWIKDCEERIDEDEKLLAEPITQTERERLEQEICSVKTQLNVYRYLWKNNITYGEYQDFAGIGGCYGDSALSSFVAFSHKLTAVLPFMFALFAVWLTEWDFFRGTYKFLYSSDVPRKRIVAARYLGWLVVAVCGVILSCSAAALIGFSYGSGKGAVFFANPSVAFRLNFFGLFLFETADILYRTVVFGSIGFALCLLTNNALLSVLPATGVFIGAFFIPVFDAPFLSILVGGAPFAFLAEGATNFGLLAVLLSEAAVTILLAAVGVWRFVKRDFK